MKNWKKRRLVVTVRPETIRFRVARELPFMATESLLMKATVAGGDRQELHEVLRRYSMEAHEAVSRGGANPLIDRILDDHDVIVEAKHQSSGHPEDVKA